MEINTNELEQKIKNGEKVIVKMGAEWCGACKILDPVFERVSSTNNTDVQMCTMDVDQNRDMVYSLGVRNIPAIKVFSNGEVVDTKVGVLKEDEIKNLINNLING